MGNGEARGEKRAAPAEAGMRADISPGCRRGASPVRRTLRACRS